MRRVFVLVVLLFTAWGSFSDIADAQEKKPWPQFTAEMKQCDAPLGTDDQGINASLQHGEFEDAATAESDEAVTLMQCYSRFKHPMFELVAAYVNARASAAYYLAHDLANSLSAAKTAIPQMDDAACYDLPANAISIAQTTKAALTMMMQKLNSSADDGNPIKVMGFDFHPLSQAVRDTDGQIIYPADGEFDYCWNFTNVSDKTATLIRFRIELVDGFGQPTGMTFTYDLVGSYSPGVSIGQRDGSGYGLGGARVNCVAHYTPGIANDKAVIEAIAVKFDDDTVWHLP